MDKSSNSFPRVFLASSNFGKLRDFAAAAAPHGIEVVPLENFAALPRVGEDEPTFEGNARKKAEHYSRLRPGTLVIADDSGLEVEALNHSPGVRSARYAAQSGSENASDEANNQRLLRELKGLPDDQRQARFVCALAAGMDGEVREIFFGQVRGRILNEARGTHGFGYDPLFFFPPLGKTFGELTAEDKAAISHRGQAFRKFLEWYESKQLETGS